MAEDLADALCFELRHIVRCFDRDDRGQQAGDDAIEVALRRGTMRRIRDLLAEIDGAERLRPARPGGHRW